MRAYKLTILVLISLMISSCKDDVTNTYITPPTDSGSSSSSNSSSSSGGNSLEKTPSIQIIGSTTTKKILINSILEKADGGEIISSDGNLLLRYEEKSNKPSKILKSNFLKAASKFNSVSKDQEAVTRYYRIASSDVLKGFEALNTIQSILDDKHENLQLRDRYFSLWYEGSKRTLLTSASLLSAGQATTFKTVFARSLKSIINVSFNNLEDSVKGAFGLDLENSSDVISRDNELFSILISDIVEQRNTDFRELLAKNNINANDYDQFQKLVESSAKANLNNEDFEYVMKKFEAKKKSDLLNDIHSRIKQTQQITTSNNFLIQNLSSKIDKTKDSLIEKLKEQDSQMLEVAVAYHDVAKNTATSLTLMNNILSNQSSEITQILDLVAMNVPASKLVRYYENKFKNVAMPKIVKEKYELAKSQYNTEQIIQSVSSLTNIAANFGIGKEAGIVSAVLSAGVQISSLNPAGITSGLATISTLFKKSQPDPRFTYIFKNFERILSSLDVINQNVVQMNQNILKMHKTMQESFEQVYKQFDLLNGRLNEIYSKMDQLHIDFLNNVHQTNLGFCSSTYRDDLGLMALSKEYIHDKGSITRCMEQLKVVFKDTQIVTYESNPFKSLRITSFDKTSHPNTHVMYTSNLIQTYFENENYDRTNVDQNYFLSPLVLKEYVDKLLYNIHWFDLLDENNNLVTIAGANQNIQQNKASIPLIKNALTLTNKVIEQFEIWSGVTSRTDLEVELYDDLKQDDLQEMSCSDVYRGIVCKSIHNPIYFQNLMYRIIKKKMGYKHLNATMYIMPNNPLHLSRIIGGAFPLVWIGEGASDDYKNSLKHGLINGEIITNPDIVKKYPESGMYFKIQTQTELKFYPVPSELRIEDYKIDKKYYIPGHEILMDLKNKLESELVHLEMSAVLDEDESLSLNNYYLMEFL